MLHLEITTRLFEPCVCFPICMCLKECTHKKIIKARKLSDFFYIFCVFILCVWVAMYGINVKVQGQLCGVFLTLRFVTSWVGTQIQQAPIATELSNWLYGCWFVYLV